MLPFLTLLYLFYLSITLLYLTQLCFTQLSLTSSRYANSLLPFLSSCAFLSPLPSTFKIFLQFSSAFSSLYNMFPTSPSFPSSFTPRTRLIIPFAFFHHWSLLIRNRTKNREEQGKKMTAEFYEVCLNIKKREEKDEPFFVPCL